MSEANNTQEPTISDLCVALTELNNRLVRIERILLAPMGEEAEGEAPSVAIRLQALEKALQFAMSNVPVTIRQESPIIGGGVHTQKTNLLDYYLAHAQQQKMLVGNADGK